MVTIGIDLGTSAVKLLLMEESGKIRNIVSRPYPLSLPRPGWSEQDPADWLRETLAGLAELTAEIDKRQVAGISFGGQMHGLVMLDDADQVIRPAILWNDGRTQEETDFLNQVVGEEALARHTANIAFAGFTLPKLLWVRRHEPEHFRRIAKVMLPKDYLAFSFSGHFGTDFSDASGTLLLDVAHRRWSPEMLDLCGLAPEQLPALHESWETVGTLRKELAEELGFPPHVRIAAGAGDNAAAAIGTGTIGEGACNISLGTSGTLFISSQTFRDSPNHALHAFAHADGGWHLMGCMLSAASCNKWWSEGILGTADYTREQAEIAALGENRIFYLPYLMGERSPHNDPAARGAFLGLSLDTTRADMTQAVLEGVAFGLRDSLEIARGMGLPAERSRLCGGGAKSPLWQRILANVLNLTLEIPAVEEGPSAGAALLAGVACGLWPDIPAACRAFVRTREIIAPEPELAARYSEKYDTFRKLYPALKGMLPVL